LRPFPYNPDKAHWYLCVDCGINTCADAQEEYVIHDHLWRSIMGSLKNGMLCIGCCEHRLDRQLSSGDFKWPLPINDYTIWSKSDRLLDRMKGMMDE